MRILQVTNKVPYPAKDGGAIACMNLSKGFARLGHELRILSMNTAKHHITLNEIPEEIKDMARFILVDVPARINPSGALLNLLFSHKPYNAVRFIDKNFREALKKVLTENKFDVIQLEGLYLCPYIPTIRKYSDALVVYRAHNIEHEIWERTAKLAGRLKKVYLLNLARRIKKFESSYINQYDVLVPISERDGEILDRMGNNRPVHISQTGIDASDLVSDPSKMDYPDLFHIGSLEWSPNQEGLLWFIEKCWPGLQKIYPELKLHIAGRNAPDWLINKISVPNVVYHGEVPDAYAFMNSKAIMIVPLFSGSGMRIKIIEGMALGKSIVSTPIGVEGIDAVNGEHILIARDENKFVEGISRLVDNRELAENIGNNAIKLIHEKFDNLAAAERLIEFYKLNRQ